MDYLFINKLSKEPYYLQIVNSIKLAIQNGRLKHNDPLPPVNLVCEHYNISNIVVIQAYQTLGDEHLITSVQGKGSFVCTIPQFEMDGLNVPSIYKILIDHQIVFHSKIAISTRPLFK